MTSGSSVHPGVHGGFRFGSTQPRPPRDWEQLQGWEPRSLAAHKVPTLPFRWGAIFTTLKSQHLLSLRSVPWPHS